MRRKVYVEPIQIKSIYNFVKDFSFRGEQFYNIPLTWRLGVCSIELVKIRVASWKPKQDRSGQAVFYFDVKTNAEAYLILKKLENYKFENIQKRFENLYLLEQPPHITGELWEWVIKIRTQLRKEYTKGFSEFLDG